MGLDMVTLLTITSVLLVSIQNVFLKEFNKRFMINLSSYYIYTIGYMFIAFLIFLAGSNFSGIPIKTIQVAIFQGVLYTISFLLYTKAFEVGPFAFTTLVFSSSIVIPVFYGIMVWGEKMKIIQIVGLMLLLITFYLGSISNEGGEKKKSLKWLIYSIGAFFGYGLIMVTSKMQQVITPGKYMREFMAITFGVAIIVAIILLVIDLIKNKAVISNLKDKKFFAIFIAHGVDSGFSSVLGLFLAGVLPSFVYYPVLNGGVVVTATIFSFAVYKDKPTKAKIAGLTTGLLSIILLCL